MRSTKEFRLFGLPNLSLLCTILEMKEKVQWPWYDKPLLAKLNSKEMAKIITFFHRKSLP